VSLFEQLARDLGAMVGDAEFADVRFIAQGRTLFAHKFVLEAKSEYFRAMFRFTSGEPDGYGVVDIVVPGMETSY
jgi:hypothetical protein